MDIAKAIRPIIGLQCLEDSIEMDCLEGQYLMIRNMYKLTL